MYNLILIRIHTYLYSFILCYVNTNTYDAAGVSRRQDQKCNTFRKMSTLWNLVTIFGILMKNALKRVQTCLVLVH